MSGKHPRRGTPSRDKNSDSAPENGAPRLSRESAPRLGAVSDPKVGSGAKGRPTLPSHLPRSFAGSAAGFSASKLPSSASSQLKAVSDSNGAGAGRASPWIDAPPLDIEGLRDTPSLEIEFREKPLHPLYCHQEEFLLYEQDGNSIVASNSAFARRANLVLQHLAAHGRTGVVKAVRGNQNQGWRRTPFGGNGGSHYYAWWAPGDAAPVRDLGLPPEAIVLRAIRHHDDHTPLTAGKLADYDSLLPQRIISELESDIQLPWTETQLSFANGEDPVRVLIGYPGTGKTTALWNSVATRAGQKSLYITWSSRLTAMADEHFQTFAPADAKVDCMTFEELVEAVIGARAGRGANRTVSGERKAFAAALDRIPPQDIGLWNQHRESLYAEIRAHLVGAALPFDIAGLVEKDRCRLSDTDYEASRKGDLGGEAVRDVLRVVSLIEREIGVETLFPELCRAFRAGQSLYLEHLRGAKARKANHGLTPVGLEPRIRRGELWTYDRIVVDETQDLTPVEAAVPLILARMIAEFRSGRPPVFLAAGDEGQTVRPTDFEWGWFKNLLSQAMTHPAETKLEKSLRYPRRIAELVNRASGLYATIAKGERPRDMRPAEATDNINDTIIHCRTTPNDPDLKSLISEMAGQPGTALVRLDPDLDGELPAEVVESLLYPAEAKGCEYQTVVLLNPGAWLNRMVAVGESGRRSLKRLWLRSAIDNFRVGLSRATETLLLLDWHPDGASGREVGELLDGLQVLNLTPAEALEQLRASDATPEERVTRSINEAEELLQVNPPLAIRRARNAVGLLGDRNRPGGVTDENIRRSAHRTLVRVAWDISARPNELPEGLATDAVVDLAATSAGLAGYDIFVTALRHAADFARMEGAEKHEAARKFLDALAKVTEEGLWFRAGLSPRVDDLVASLRALAREHTTAERIAKQAQDLLAALSFHVPQALGDVEATAESIRAASAETLVRANLFHAARDVMRLMTNPPLPEYAKCEEELSRPADAAPLFEKAEMPEDALRCWRKAREFGKAAAVAQALGKTPMLRRLEWLQRIKKLSESRPQDLMRHIEEHEKSWLRDVLGDMGR